MFNYPPPPYVQVGGTKQQQDAYSFLGEIFTDLPINHSVVVLLHNVEITVDL